MTRAADVDEQLDPIRVLHRCAPVPARSWRPTARRCTARRLPSVGPLVLSEIDALRAGSDREPPGLAVRVLELGSMVVIGLEGVLDEATAPVLQGRLPAVRTQVPRLVVFDLSLLQALTDDGARAVIEVERQVRIGRGRFAVRQPSAAVRDALWRGGLPDDVEIEG